MKIAVTKSCHRRAFMYLKAGKGSRHFWKCNLQYLGTDSWNNLFFVLLVLVITFKKKKCIPPTNLKLISCLPAGHHKWKHFHNDKTDQNMFHIWWVQIQRKWSLELTIIFCVRNFLMRVSLKVHYFKTEVGKRSEKRVKSCNIFFFWGCRDIRSWLLIRAELAAATTQKAINLLSSPNLKLFNSQTNLLTRQRQPGEGVLA